MVKEEIIDNETNYRPFIRQCFLTAAVALNIVGHGCVIGYSAVLIPSLRHPESHIKATHSEESWIASVIGFALITGNFIITPLMDTIGRKRSHLLTILPNLVGWFLLIMVDSVAGLIAARFLQGISMGMLGPLGSIIIGEMTDPRNRGAFLTSVSLSLTIGVMLSHALGTYFSWQQTALICSFITFTSLILIIFNPESPSWLIAKGRYEKGEEIFYWLRGRNDAQENELESMISAHRMMRKSSFTDKSLPMGVRIRRFCSYLRKTSVKPEFYKPIIIMFALYTMFQFAGINVISSYAMDIIHQVVGPEANAKFLMVALDVERLVCNIVAVFLMKSMRRRTLLFSSSAICVLSYLCKAFYVYAKENGLVASESHWIPITLIAVYMFSLTVGISSIPFAISGEIFALEYRGLGGGISVWALSLNFFVAVKCFPVLNVAIGLSLTYILYAGIVVLCLIILYFLLPETKDRTLQEIEDSFRGISGTHRRADQRVTEPLNDAGTIIHGMRRHSSHILY